MQRCIKAGTTHGALADINAREHVVHVQVVPGRVVDALAGRLACAQEFPEFPCHGAGPFRLCRRLTEAFRHTAAQRQCPPVPSIQKSE